MIEMTVESVRINLQTSQRVVILKATKQERYLFIWIAHAEAYAIAIELQGTSSPRPLTHELLKNVIQDLGAKIVSIVISDLIEDIFYARIVLDVAGRHVEITPKGESRKDREIEYDNLDAYRDFINSLDVLDEFGKE